MDSGHHLTAAFYRLVGTAVFAFGLAIGTGRPDLAVLAAPFVLLLVQAALLQRPERGRPRAVAALHEVQGQGTRAQIDVVLTGIGGAQLATVALPSTDGTVTGQRVAVPADRLRLTAETPPLTWGPVLLARPDVAAIGPDGLWDTMPTLAPELSAAIVPAVPKVDGLQLRPIVGGWSGEHVSRRPGQGNELIDLRQYAPGDRLRSIHWRAYARHQQLYVRRTESSADAEIVLCLDTRHDIGPGRDIARSRTTIGRTVRGFGEHLEAAFGWLRRAASRSVLPPADPPSSLDLLVAAAAAIAATQLRTGDRVGVLDLAAPGRHLRMGTGTRHLQRIRQQLGQLTPSNAVFAIKAEQLRLPSSAVVVFCSALVDDSAVHAALEVDARGHQVQVVDVLPVNALRIAAGRRHLVPGERAARIVRLAALEVVLAERDLRLDRLRGAGIPVLRWEGGQIATDIRVATRLRRDRR